MGSGFACWFFLTCLWVSIQLVFPASGKNTTTILWRLISDGFHSISFPSEWEVYLPAHHKAFTSPHVSIQLVFPASGKTITPTPQCITYRDVSIQLVFPASGKSKAMRNQTTHENYGCFHSISFPSEWEVESPVQDLLPPTQ